MQTTITTFTAVGRYLAMVCCLFLLNSCDETRYIDEKDIVNVKPGGVVTIRKDVAGVNLINLVSDCALLGVREVNGLNNKRQFRADFQTVNKAENLIFSVEFLLSELVTSDSALCEITEFNGSFRSNNSTLDFRDINLNPDLASVRFSNFSEKGKTCNFIMNSSVATPNGTENWEIKFQSALLP
jgi:hypothetical protein